MTDRLIEALKQLTDVNNNYSDSEYCMQLTSSMSSTWELDHVSILVEEKKELALVCALEKGRWLSTTSIPDNAVKTPICNLNNEPFGCLITSQTDEPTLKGMLPLYASSLAIQLRPTSSVTSLLKSEIQNRDEELIKTMDELDTFFYRASHDIREPITALQGVYNLIRARSEMQSDPTLPLLEKQIVRLKNFNESLVQVGAIKSRIPEPSQVHLKSLVDRIVADCSDDFVEVENTIDSNLKVTKDTFLLECIIGELVRNSFQYFDVNKDHSWLRLRSSTDSSTHTVVIEDNGIGINDQLAPNLFSMFFRASASSGTGLGLYKAKMAADKSFIPLHIESQEGIGTKATLTIQS